MRTAMYIESNIEVPCVTIIAKETQQCANCIVCIVEVYRVSHELSLLLRESVPYVKVYRYNPKHLCAKLNVYGNNGHRKVWASEGSTYCTPSVTP